MKLIIFGIKKKHLGKFGNLQIMLNKKYWKNKKVLVTGHSGFTGSWLCFVLKLFGSKVYGLSLKPNTKPSLFRLLEIEKIISNNYFLNINNKNKIEKIIKKIEPEIIFHLAAQPLVKLSITNPLETFQTNVMGTINICDISRKLIKLKKLILVTTDKCYKNVNSKKISFFKENDELGGNDPYSASKACAEISINSYTNIFFKNKDIKISSVRAGNIIGGGDWSKDRLIPDIYRSIYSSKVLKIRYPNATRPWQHVLEVIGAYLKLAESNYSGPWNFGPNTKKSYKVRDILIYIRKMNKNLKWQITEPKEKQESINLNLNVSKARKKLKWKPKWDIKKTIIETDKWYRDFYNKKNIKKLTITQIKEYFNL